MNTNEPATTPLQDTSGIEEYEGLLPPGEVRFEQIRKIAGAILAPVAFYLTYRMTAGLGYQGQMLSAVLSTVAVLWVSEALPLPVTSLLGAALCIVLGVADAKTVLAPFADPIVFLFIGSFILARAMSLHKLDRRIALGFLSWPWISAHQARVLAGFGLVTAFLYMWISNTASAAMMLPIALGIVHAMFDVRQGDSATGAENIARWPFATGMLLMTSFAASIGGMATPVGTPPNLIGIGFIRQLAGYQFSFFGWMAVAFPIFVVMGVALFFLLYFMHPADHRASHSRELLVYLRQEQEKLGPWTAGQVNTLIALVTAFVLWNLPGVLALFLPQNDPALRAVNAHLPESVVALLVVLLLFVLPTNVGQGRFTLSWQEAGQIDWGTILLFGGGLSLGSLMFSTGAARALGNEITGLTGASGLWELTAVAILLAIFLSETTSNTAAASMVMPVVISLAQTAGVNPIPPALGACLGASFGFMLPVSTPPNAIVYGSGLVPIPKMIRAGILLDLLGFVIIWVGLRLLCPLMDMV